MAPRRALFDIVLGSLQQTVQNVVRNLEGMKKENERLHKTAESKVGLARPPKNVRVATVLRQPVAKNVRSGTRKRSGASLGRPLVKKAKGAHTALAFVQDRSETRNKPLVSSASDRPMTGASRAAAQKLNQHVATTMSVASAADSQGTVKVRSAVPASADSQPLSAPVNNRTAARSLGAPSAKLFIYISYSELAKHTSKVKALALASKSVGIVLTDSLDVLKQWRQAHPAQVRCVLRKHDDPDYEEVKGIVGSRNLSSIARMTNLQAELARRTSA